MSAVKKIPVLPNLKVPGYALWLGWTLGGDYHLSFGERTSAIVVTGQALVREDDYPGLGVHPQPYIREDGAWDWMRMNWSVTHLRSGYRILPGHYTPPQAMLIASIMGEMALRRGLRWDVPVEHIEESRAYKDIAARLAPHLRKDLALESILRIGADLIRSKTT